MNNRVSVITKSVRTTRHLVSRDPKRSRRPIQIQRQTGHLSAHTVMTMMTSAIAQVAVPEAARPSTHDLIQHRASHPER
jgi:hypothetical protein